MPLIYEPFLIRRGNGETELGRPLSWRLDCLPRTATCPVTGQPMPLRLSLVGEGAHVVPDVELVELWLTDLLRLPRDADEVALRAARQFLLCAECVAGPAGRRGVVTARASAPGEDV